jgi:hypothetical protein
MEETKWRTTEIRIIGIRNVKTRKKNKIKYMRKKRNIFLDE